MYFKMVVGDIGLDGSEYQPGKTEWPEVVGLASEEAENKIKREAAAGTKIHVVPSNSFVTTDFRMDRVRIFIDSSGKVVKPPRIG